MPQYVMLSQVNSEGLKNLRRNPYRLHEIQTEIERHDAKVLHRLVLPGQNGILTIVEAANNLSAFQLEVDRHAGGTAKTQIFPAIDLDLFVRLLGQTTETTGPFKWQTSWWAQVLRRMLRYSTMTSMVWKYCKPLTVEGRDNLKELKGPAIFIGNHSSHMDASVLFTALPGRFRRS